MRKLVLDVWDKTHSEEEIAKYFSVNKSTVYRLVERRERTVSYETRTNSYAPHRLLGGSCACHRLPASGRCILGASYPHLHALPLQIPEGYPRKLGLFQYLLVQIVELMELVWRSGLGIEEHIGRVGFR